MNKWTKESIKAGNNDGYLDIIFNQIFKFENPKRRKIPISWIKIEEYYNSKNSLNLFEELLKNEIFPFEDTATGYFKILRRSDKRWFEKNPKQRDRILSKIYAMGLEKLKLSLTRPKKGNQSIGPMFKNWIVNSKFCIPVININNYKNNIKDCILSGSDNELKNFARKKFNYLHKKGLDFVAKKNNKFIIGEQKLITDQGGNQDKSLADVYRLLTSSLKDCTKIAILDGVIYIKNKKNLYKSLVNSDDKHIMLSALLLDNFLKEFK